MMIGIARSIQEPDAGDRFHRSSQCLNRRGIPAFAEIGNALDDLRHWIAIGGNKKPEGTNCVSSGWSLAS
jgi:hypothetical protein